MVPIYKDSIIYLLAPANSASGGQEALHELGHYLIREGFRASIAYYQYDRQNSSPVHDKFIQYEVPFTLIDEIKDETQNFLICPEAATDHMKSFTQIRKAIWWLSVGFYRSSIRNSSLLKLFTSILQGKFSRVPEILRLRKAVFRFNDNSIIHFTGSHFTFDFVSGMGAKPSLLVQPLGMDFLNNVLATPLTEFISKSRENVILYNPAKGSKVMDQLMQLYPDLPFIPLKGFTPDELIERMKTARLYVDFGKFPGPERLPKEAVVNGCCILTGRRGASDFYGDVRIPDEYKMNSDTPIEEIHDKITDMLENYDIHIGNFEAYRQMVYGLEKGFIQQIREYFIKE